MDEIEIVKCDLSYLDELLIIFICLCFYFIVYLSYRLIDKYLIKKSTIKLWKE